LSDRPDRDRNFIWSFGQCFADRRLQRGQSAAV
jgi:hypothetical protein